MMKQQIWNTVSPKFASLILQMNSQSFINLWNCKIKMVSDIEMQGYWNSETIKENTDHVFREMYHYNIKIIVSKSSWNG